MAGFVLFGGGGGVRSPGVGGSSHLERGFLHPVPKHARCRFVRPTFAGGGGKATAHSAPHHDTDIGNGRCPRCWLRGGARGHRLASNELERLYLTAMEFHVNVKASLYARS